MPLLLDVTGAVVTEHNGDQDTKETVFWSDISPFAQGYVEGAKQAFPTLQLSEALKGARGYRGCPSIALDWTFGHLSPEAIALILKDCDAARKRRIADTALGGKIFWSERQAGRIRAFPPLTPFLSDDGRVHLREGV